MGTLAVRALFFLAPSILFMLFDSIIPSLAVGIKTQGQSALPTRGNKRGGRAPPWYQVIGLSLFNICLSVAVQAGVELLFTDVLKIWSALKITTQLPMPWSIAKEVLRGLLLREVLQYYIHRFVLHPSSPNAISRLHNSYFHSISSPYSFAAHYDHPASYLLFRFLPTYLPSIIFRLHLLTYLLLLSIVSLEESLTLSGYTTIPGIMLGGIARRQDLHSEGRGKGNFAPWGLMDWLHGTSLGRDVVEDMRDEAEKHQVKERGGNVLESAKQSGKQGARAWTSRRKSGKRA